MATIIKKGTSKSEINKSIRKVVSERKSKELLKLAGTLKSDVNPIDYQKHMRDEWQ